MHLDANERLNRELAAKKAQAVRLVRAMRAMGQASRRTRIPRQRPPNAIESDYATQLIRIVDVARQATRPLLEELPRLVALVAAARERVDAGEGSRVHDLMEVARARVAEATNKEATVGLILRIAQRASTFQRIQLAKQVKAALGVPLWTSDRTPTHVDSIRVDAVASVVEGFVAQNVTLIKSLGAQPLDQVEKLVVRAFTDGTRHEELAEEIKRRYEVAESSARLIARDQLATVTAQVGRERNKELGIQTWIWRTVGDEAVRDEHAEREGNEYPMDYDGLRPGDDINCRCYEEPVFTDILDELDALEAEAA